MLTQCHQRGYISDACHQCRRGRGFIGGRSRPRRRRRTSLIAARPLGVERQDARASAACPQPPGHRRRPRSRSRPAAARSGPPTRPPRRSRAHRRRGPRARRARSTSAARRAAIAISPDGDARARDHRLLRPPGPRDRRPARAARSSASTSAPSRARSRSRPTGAAPTWPAAAPRARSPASTPRRRASTRRSRSARTRAASRSLPTASTRWSRSTARPRSRSWRWRSGASCGGSRRAPFPREVAVSPDGKRALVTHNGFGDAHGHARSTCAQPARRPPRRRSGSTPPASPSRAPARSRWSARRGSGRAVVLDGRSGRRRAHGHGSAARRAAVAVAGGSGDRRRRPQRAAQGDPARERADERHPPRGAARGRRSAPAAALGAGALGRGAAEAAEAPARKPNILILMCDQERYPQWTPDLPLPARDWIDSRGVSFERFHHSAVQCSPSRACFWTGMYPPQHGIFGNFLQSWQFSLDPRIPTIGDLMREQGYTTAFFGKWHLSMVGLSVPEGPVENLARQLPRPVRLRLLRPGAVARARGLQRRHLQRPDLDQAGRSTGCAQHGGPGEAVVHGRLAAQPARHRLLPARLHASTSPGPTGRSSCRSNFEDDPATKPTVHSQYAEGAALIRGGIARRRHRDVAAAA